MLNRETFLGLVTYAGLLCSAALIAKYFFKINLAVFIMSLLFLIVYILSLMLSGLTKGADQNVLFNIWNIISLLVIVIGIGFSFKLKAMGPAFLLSLFFQIPYLIFLYYYGGVIFTHKFD